MKQTVLITGASGRIGSALVNHLDATAGQRYRLRLADLEASGERCLQLDVTDFASCAAACAGADLVVHLAAEADPDAAFESLLPVNIAGTYNIFHAASEAGARRVVFASSAHVVAGYPLDVQVRSDMPVRPPNLYGTSKAFGEALASYFAYEKGLEAIAVRIGAFGYAEDWKTMSACDLSAWASPRDLCSLLVRCLEADLGDDRFVIAHGISDNRFKRLDLSETRARLGYSPQDDAFETWHVGLHDKSEMAA
jgi:uronate dehydrogenase